MVARKDPALLFDNGCCQKLLARKLLANLSFICGRKL